jgi:sensor histidine kinase YesM
LPLVFLFFLAEDFLVVDFFAFVDLINFDSTFDALFFVFLTFFFLAEQSMLTQNFHSLPRLIISMMGALHASHVSPVVLSAPNCGSG